MRCLGTGGDKMKNNKGFTLVELLVVIAIIAVLSAIAIVNLNNARTKGNDSSIKANLAALPAAGEIFYDDNGNSYNGFCADSAIDGVRGNVNNISMFGCTSSASGWAAGAPLESGDYYCVDSTGRSSSTITDANAGVVCF